MAVADPQVGNMVDGIRTHVMLYSAPVSTSKRSSRKLRVWTRSVRADRECVLRPKRIMSPGSPHYAIGEQRGTGDE
jgi:hypothetical protein